MNHRHLSYLLAATLSVGSGVMPLVAQDKVHYTGTTLSDPNRHDGGLSPVVGVHNIQIMRANREHPSAANGGGWTYNHQPMMAWWHGRFFVHYLCDPVGEQEPPSHTNLQVSADGYHWTDPVILFPEYPVPDGFTKPDVEGVAKNMVAVMHQRMGWYVSSEGRLYALGYYGVCLNAKDHNNDGNGIGRVIREVRDDGSLGPIYFIYYNHGFNASNTRYPNYTKGDRHLRRACEEIRSNPRILMQWVEEADRGEPMIPLKQDYKAYNDYTLPDGRVVALWKHALTSISADGGRTWQQPVERAKGFVNSNAKIWGQRLSDGTFATVYNPSEFRWPLALSLSSDGLEYTTLNLVNGEVPPMRYGGNYKSRGPQYVRGIQEGNGTPPDGDLWVSYSMNKEDMWVAHVPVPVLTQAHAQANDDFSRFGKLADLRQWNLYSPVMAPVGLDGQWLTLSDSDPFDYCKAERPIRPTADLTVEFDLQAGQVGNGTLQIDFAADNGVAASRLELTPDGELRLKTGARYSRLGTYAARQTLHLKVHLSVARRLAEVWVDGKAVGKGMFFAPVAQFSRIVFRTGETRTFPTVDTPADWFGTLPNAGDTDPLAIYRIAHFTTTDGMTDGGSALLKADDYRHYVDYFNGMEDENVSQAIPNRQAWDWMKANVPLFDAPDKQFEQMWYYRWWTLRKHIEKTPVGYAMTEFLVPRSYADRYNLISSALGHHIHESRWLREPQYLEQTLRTWLRGNGGKPMAKLSAYSSWLAASVWDKYLVDGRRDSLTDLLPDLLAEYRQWDGHRWKADDGVTPTLYWQYDVRDAMEETISGGRREKNARPSINSYMYGNARALARIADLAGDKVTAQLFDRKADTLRQLVQQRLWNDTAQFFQVRYPDGRFAGVREAIGFLPWYFNLPDDQPRYAQAWLQAADSKGFSAPYGQTTAEQRHPAFRTHGVGKCEWDGAVWPFATSQTLTAMANYLDNYSHPVITDSLYFAELEKYVQSQSHRGRPYIGEYLDEQTGAWLMGDRERSRYYNHSTFNDLIITGLCGLRPRADKVLEVNPLLPKDKWAWFCVDNIPYHGHTVTIVWDRDGSRYHAGRGLSLWVDGQPVARRDDIGRLTAQLP